MTYTHMHTHTHRKHFAAAELNIPWGEVKENSVFQQVEGGGHVVLLSFTASVAEHQSVCYL